ncbi:MAG: restriction endonuclease [Candidatus Izemoplasmatales bacterium]
MDAFNQETRKKIEEAVLSFLRRNGPAERKKLFSPAYVALQVTDEDIKDNAPSGNYSKAKSYIGMIVSELVAEGKVLASPEGALSAPAPKPEPVVEKKPVKVAEKAMPLSDAAYKALVLRILGKYLSAEETLDNDPNSLAGVLRSQTGAMLRKHPELAAKDEETIFRTVSSEIEKTKGFRDRFHREKESEPEPEPAPRTEAPKPEPAKSAKTVKKPTSEPEPTKPNGAKARQTLVLRILDHYLSGEETLDNDPNSLAGVLRSQTGAILKNHPELAGKDEDEVFATVTAEIEKTKGFKDRFASRTAPEPEKAPAVKPARKRAKKAEPEPQGEPAFPIESIDRLIRETAAKHALCVSGKLSRERYEKVLLLAVSHLFADAEEFFENFSFQLIKRLYGTAVIDQKFTPGPEDEGVDGEIVVEDPAGYRETIMMQAKTKKNDKASISMKVLREYVGVMHLRGADKVLIISNSTITKDAKEKSKRLKYVKLVDVRELVEWMKKTRFGLVVEDGAPKIDAALLRELIGVK